MRLKLGNQNQQKLTKTGKRGGIEGAGIIEARWRRRWSWLEPTKQLRRRPTGEKQPALPEPLAQEAATYHGCDLPDLGLRVQNWSLPPPPPPRRLFHCLHLPPH